MFQAYFRFYAQLNDFLLPSRKQIRFTHCFKENRSIKDMIESLGVPHPEIKLILINREVVDFSYSVQDSDWISVYPFFTSVDITSLVNVQPQPLKEARFVLDIHLGKLATYLRLLGFDTLYQNDYQDEELALISNQEERILLTQDRGLLKRSLVVYGYYVRASDPWQQLIEVLQRFDLFKQIHPFQRCLHCNGLVTPIAKEMIGDRLLPLTQKYYHEFHICQHCDRLYWKGSHYQKMQRLVNQVLEY